MVEDLPGADDRRLLILDDDEAAARMLSRVAKYAGIEARTTTEPAAFLAALDAWSPTHIALDLVMPDMDGVEVMVELARRRSRARVIITSGVGGRVLSAASRSAAEHGLDVAGVLSKPFFPGELLALMDAPAPAEASAPRSGPAARPPTPPPVTEADLREALATGAITLVYQPKVSCATGALAGFEALARWRHPTRGFISPASFIPIAEATGLIDPLTERVFDLALPWFVAFCGADAARAAPGIRDQLTLSVNISPKTLDDRSLVESITERCARAGCAPARVVLELTETAAMDDPVASLDLLTRLRMKGFLLSIDDFGTGFSSMLQLVRLPFSEMKVDKSFVLTARTSRESRTVIRSVIELARALRLSTTAEGVEDAETLDLIKSAGCDLAQGFFIARPMPGDEIAPWYRVYRSQAGGS